MNTEELIKEFQGKIEELKNINKSPNRRDILAYIDENLKILDQELDNLSYRTTVYCANQVSIYALKAESLIELLEIHDCGYIDGFDKGHDRLRTLWERFQALCNKYENL